VRVKSQALKQVTQVSELSQISLIRKNWISK